jgi:hypothetical protein
MINSIILIVLFATIFAVPPPNTQLRVVADGGLNVRDKPWYIIT